MPIIRSIPQRRFFLRKSVFLYGKNSCFQQNVSWRAPDHRCLADIQSHHDEDEVLSYFPSLIDCDVQMSAYNKCQAAQPNLVIL